MMEDSFFCGHNQDTPMQNLHQANFALVKRRLSGALPKRKLDFFRVLMAHEYQASARFERTFVCPTNTSMQSIERRLPLWLSKSGTSDPSQDVSHAQWRSRVFEHSDGCFN